jgi:hypothetical protein
MDQLVFVHGVAARKDANYDLQIRNRDGLFREVAWKGRPVTIRNPYWGNCGVAFSHGLACLPKEASGAVPFSLGLGGGDIGLASGSAIEPLAALAKVDFGAAVDTIFVAMIEEAEAGGRPLTADQVAQFATAGEYAVADPAPDWARRAQSDATFVHELQKRIAPRGPVSFGLVDALLAAVRYFLARVPSGFAPLIRDRESPAVAVFLGDIFTYLYGSDREPNGSGGESNRSRIRRAIAEALNAAVRDARDQGGRIVVIGHSLGGVILYDMLANRAPELDDGIAVDLFVSVGSQPALFQEMGLFGAAIEAPAKAPRPDAVRHWWNVYDPGDLLSFRCEPVFADVVDFEFSSAAALIDAHGSYFKSPRFHARLCERLTRINMMS